VPNGQLSGWTSDAGWIQVWRTGPGGWNAAQGVSWIELDSDERRDRISQRVTTVKGETLELSFAYSYRPGYGKDTNRFQVLWNGAVLETLEPNGKDKSSPSWQTRRYTVKATGSDTVTFCETGTNDGYGTLIDNVVLKRP
jgi:hypothetical protein